MHADLEQLVVDQIVPSLLDQGFFFIDNFLGEFVGHIVLGQVKNIHHAGLLKDGQLAGRGLGVSKRNIRGDKIAWVSGAEKGCEAVNFLLTLIDNLISICVGQLGIRIRERSKVSASPLRRALSMWANCLWPKIVLFLCCWTIWTSNLLNCRYRSHFIWPYVCETLPNLV